MLSVIGAIIVLLSVVGGFILEGGNVAVLVQPVEWLIIGGAAGGSLIVACSPSLLKQVIHQIIGVLKPSGLDKAGYLQLLLLLFEICKTAKLNPLSLEPHIENPEESEIFKRYPMILKNHHTVDFICDTLKVQISAGMSPYDLEELMETDIETLHAEEAGAPEVVNRMAQAGPGLGIVAAVMGVVLTMGKLNLGKEVIGHSVAAALVGTFTGILLCYGFLEPLAARMTLGNSANGQLLSVAKICLLAYAKNCSPKVCVEFARRTVPMETRPTFSEVDEATSAAGKQQQAA